MLDQLLEQLTPAGYDNLKLAVETGRWPGGQRLSEQQQEHALQLLLAYQARYLDQTEHFTIAADGRLNLKSKAELKQQFQDAKESSD